MVLLFLLFFLASSKKNVLIPLELTDGVFSDHGTYFTRSSWKAKHGSWLGKVAVCHVRSHLSLHGTWSLFSAMWLVLN